VLRSVLHNGAYSWMDFGNGSYCPKSGMDFGIGFNSPKSVSMGFGKRTMLPKARTDALGSGQTELHQTPGRLIPAAF